VEWIKAIIGAIMTRGIFISVEGGEGVGKSTQISLLATAIRDYGYDVIITREPGGTEGAEVIRQLLLNGTENRWEPRTEALLFAAARSDHVARLIKPALDSGKWVIADRYLDSSRAYQGGGSGISDADIMTLHGIGSMGLLPDRTLVLGLPLQVSIDRAAIRDANLSDRIGGRNTKFHEAVAAAFRNFALQEPDRIKLIDAQGSIEQVSEKMLASISDLLP
jgi:dTMP kinase